MTPPTTAAIYIRPGPLAPSVTDQLQQLTDRANQHGWSTRVFSEEQPEERAAWSACLALLQQGCCRVLLVTSLDRLGLRLPALVNTLGRLAASGVRLIALEPGLDATSNSTLAFGDYCTLLLGCERALHAEQTRIGMDEARRRGRRIGPGRQPFDKARATQLRDLGWGQIRIARELGVGVGRVHHWVKTEYLPPEQRVRQIIEDGASSRTT